MFLKLFRSAPEKAAARALYAEVVRQSRRPVFYDEFGVADTPTGRFEMIALHAALILRRLRGAGADAERLSQAFADAMFADLDGALRELGVGDLTVPKKIRKMAEAFYGRLASYDRALAAEGPELAQAIAKNLYGEASETANAAALAVYLRRQDAELSSRPLGRFLNGVAQFTDEGPVAPAPRSQEKACDDAGILTPAAD